jgi:hypothetical protein
MGVLTDLFIATDAEVERLAPDAIPLERFGGVDIKGVGTIKLAELDAILCGVDFDQAMDRIELVRARSEKLGPWITRMPPELVAALAALDETEIVSYGERWAATEEFVEDGWYPEDVVAVLGQMVELARHAVADGKAVYAWTSL